MRIMSANFPAAMMPRSFVTPITAADIQHPLSGHPGKNSAGWDKMHRKRLTIDIVAPAVECLVQEPLLVVERGTSEIETS